MNTPVKKDLYFTVKVLLKNGMILTLPCESKIDEIYENIDTYQHIAFGNTIIKTSEIVYVEHIDPMLILVSKA